jgi:biofilm protein TabA
VIHDTLSNWERNRRQYGEAVNRALAFVRTIQIGEMPSTVEIDGSRMYVMRQTPDTVPFADRFSEIHDQYADIHLVVEGEEWQGYASASDGNLADTNKLQESDYALFANVFNESFIRLEPGDFTVYWPGEFHRPNCCPDGASRSRLVKLVVKIHKDLF